MLAAAATPVPQARAFRAAAISRPRFRDGLRHAYRDRVLRHDIADAQRARINLARDHRGHDVTVSYDPNRLGNRCASRA
jgi:hypothetical protein